MDINQLEVFLAVAQEKSFSRARKRCIATQPAVSQAIRRWRRNWASLCSIVSSKDGTLTAAGRVLLDFASR